MIRAIQKSVLIFFSHKSAVQKWKFQFFETKKLQIMIFQ